MRKMIAALTACGAVMVMASAAPTQASSKDPVSALKELLAPGRGVHFAETATVLDGADRREGRKRRGAFEFDNVGIQNLDITMTRGKEGWKRVIGIGQTSYESGGDVKKWIPKGKTWYMSRHQLFLHHSQLLGFDEQVINPAEPKTLAALLRNGKLSGKTVTGTITFKELDKVSHWFTSSEHRTWSENTKIYYTLTLTSTGLVGRVQSSYAATKTSRKDVEGKTFHVDTHYSAWGSETSIKAPDPRTVADELPIDF
ncbi:hypothetical protein ACQEVF_28215 [Nonomuraea polychroma]|uniref:hypothetical protein n=1 Tax=Nonomuraea polychroma TaxID=46176 RepID=UPI003D8FDABC